MLTEPAVSDPEAILYTVDHRVDRVADYPGYTVDGTLHYVADGTCR